MDIENTWQQGSGSDDALNRLLESDLSNLHSKLPLKKLKNNLLIGIIWAVLITAAYITLFFFIAIWQVYVALGCLIIFNTWVIFDSWRLYKSTNANISVTNSLKQELEKNYTSFQKWWSIQQRVSLFLFPIALAGGFMFGGVLGSGKTVEGFLYNSKMLLLLGITILVLVPIFYYVAKWMFDYAYGKYLKKIKTLINELS